MDILLRILLNTEMKAELYHLTLSEGKQHSVKVLQSAW